MFVKLALEDGAPAMKRILLRDVKNIDDLEQLHYVLKAYLEEHEELQIEIWANAENQKNSLPSELSVRAITTKLPAPTTCPIG